MGETQNQEGEKRTVVRTQEVKKIYDMGQIRVHALRGVNLEVHAGEYLSIMGPSGSGKSTLFNMVGGLDKPSEGKVYIDEVDVAQLDAYELAWLRCRKIGYIFQSFNLIPVMTALENVTLPMVFAGLSSDDSRDKGLSLLEKVGLGDRRSHRPNELSGGQQQRVAVARAMANDPGGRTDRQPRPAHRHRDHRAVARDELGIGCDGHLRNTRPQNAERF